MSVFDWPAAGVFPDRLVGAAGSALGDADGLPAAAGLGAAVAMGAGVSAGGGAEVFTPGSRSAGLGASCEGAAGRVCCAQPQGATTNRALTSNTVRMSTSRLRARSRRRRRRGFLIRGGLRCSRLLPWSARRGFRRRCGAVLRSAIGRSGGWSRLRALQWGFPRTDPQLCNPPADGLLFARKLFVTLERRARALGVAQVKIRNHPQVPVGSRKVGISRDRLLVRGSRIRELAPQALRSP